MNLNKLVIDLEKLVNDATPLVADIEALVADIEDNKTEVKFSGEVVTQLISLLETLAENPEVQAILIALLKHLL
jgi:hypothetical protein